MEWGEREGYVLARSKWQMMEPMGQNVNSRLIWAKGLWMFFVLCWHFF